MSTITKKLVMSKLFGFFDGKNGQDFFADNDRFYKMEMTTAMSGQNAKESALVKKRVSKDYFFEFAIIPQTAQNDLIDDISIMPAEQELAECDEIIAQQSVKNILRKITYANGAWIEIDYTANTATVSDTENADLVMLSQMILDGFEGCNKFIELEAKFNKTIAYIAKPSDSRCSWWCVQIPEDQQLDGARINAPFLKRGADLELKSGDMLIDSEANHHRKNRGFSVVLIVCDGEKIQFIHPTASRKAFIKAYGGQDLMHESGDVNGCVRMAVWLRRQPDFKVAVGQLLECS